MGGERFDSKRSSTALTESRSGSAAKAAAYLRPFTDGQGRVSMTRVAVTSANVVVPLLWRLRSAPLPPHVRARPVGIDDRADFDVEINSRPGLSPQRPPGLTPAPVAAPRRRWRRG